MVKKAPLPVRATDQIHFYGIGSGLRIGVLRAGSGRAHAVTEVPMDLFRRERRQVGVEGIEHELLARACAIRSMDVCLFDVFHHHVITHLIEVDAFAQCVHQVQLHGIGAGSVVAVVGGQCGLAGTVTKVPFVAQRQCVRLGGARILEMVAIAVLFLLPAVAEKLRPGGEPIDLVGAVAVGAEVTCKPVPSRGKAEVVAGRIQRGGEWQRGGKSALFGHAVVQVRSAQAALPVRCELEFAQCAG